ncbi:cytochrome P450 [Actinomadura madurae]|nr:cytochrome P450 [Actinomadura madurae]MCQ0019023.1 cytochrome P450 [Actinomadura madurae]
MIYTDAFFRDPHPVYARLREEAPVLKMKDPNGLAYWLITRYDEARAALADERLSKDPRRAWDALRAAGIVSGEPQDATFDLHSVDPPEHTRLRDLVTRAFTPGRVTGLEPRVREITDGLLDAMAAGDTADLIGDFAYPLSLTVISELVGVPAPDLDDFRVWVTAALTPRFVRDPLMSREEGGRRLREYVTDLVAAKAAAERADAPDLLSALLTAHERDGRLSSAEVVALTQQLLFAGHEPTTNLIGNGMAALFRNPDQLRLLRDRPDLLPGGDRGTAALRRADRARLAALRRRGHRDRRGHDPGGVGGHRRAGRRRPRSRRVRRSRPPRPHARRPSPRGLRARDPPLPRRAAGPPGGPDRAGVPAGQIPRHRARPSAGRARLAALPRLPGAAVTARPAHRPMTEVLPNRHVRN